ncbi:apolipoprotein Eb [Neosynchiropus ocellatus]
MKSVALILVLALFTGCNARAVPADVSTTNWEDSVERFWQQVSQLNQNAAGVLDNLKATQLSRELDTLISDTMAELTAYKADIQAKIKPYTDVSTGQLSTDFQLLANKLQQDMMDAKERSTEYLGELKTMVEQNTDDVRTRVSSYTHKLKKRLNKDTQEIRNTVATYMEEIQSRATQNMETVKEKVEPFVQQAQDTASKKMTDLSSMLISQAEGLGQQLESQAEGLKTQLESTAEELRTSLEGKLEELTDMFSPYAAKIKENIDTIVEKVKEASA